MRGVSILRVTIQSKPVFVGQGREGGRERRERERDRETEREREREKGERESGRLLALPSHPGRATRREVRAPAATPPAATPLTQCMPATRKGAKGLGLRV